MTTRTRHEITFPRYDLDVDTRRRTLFHAVVGEGTFTVGDEIHLVDKPSRVQPLAFPRCAAGVLTSVRQVTLLAELDADMAMLGVVDRDGYLASWDALHPDAPSATDPMVWRIEFRYGISANDGDDRPNPPEWGLAG